MARFSLRSLRRAMSCASALAAFGGCSATPDPWFRRQPGEPRPAVSAPAPAPKGAPDPAHPVMLGIDVLAARGDSSPSAARRSAADPSGRVNMHGVSTIEVLRHAPGVHLAALFAAEHGLYGEYRGARELSRPHGTHGRGLMVHSLYTGIRVDGVANRPTKAQLKGPGRGRHRPAGHRLAELHLRQRDEGSAWRDALRTAWR